MRISLFNQPEKEIKHQQMQGFVKKSLYILGSLPHILENKGEGEGEGDGEGERAVRD